MSLLSAFGFSTKLDYHLKKMENDINNPYKISVDSIKREYYLHIPNNLPNNAPFIMVFHGYSGNALNTIKTTNFNQLADKNGFIACYPQGLIDED